MSELRATAASSWRTLVFGHSLAGGELHSFAHLFVALLLAGALTVLLLTLLILLILALLVLGFADLAGPADPDLC